MMQKFKGECKKLVEKSIDKKLIKQVNFETPPKEIEADLSLPCFSFTKQIKTNPNIIAKELSEKIMKKMSTASLIERIESIGPYVNFHINYVNFSKQVIKEILTKKSKYGSEPRKNKNIIIDYSSPNIAKPMTVGHLRSAIIGQSLYNTYTFLGYKCIGDNHLGDVGTQFGKLILSYKLWGNKKMVEKDPIKELLKLYVNFHKEAEKNKELEDKAREWSKKLEQSDRQAVKLWKWFVRISIKEFNKVYRLFGIKFDYQLGESFYLPMLKDVIKESLNKKVAKQSEGAVIISLENYNLPPLLIQRSDTATLYSTRDLAAIKYRKKKFRFDKCLYVVGSEQKLYFQQLFKASELLGYSESDNCIHVCFGLMTLPEGKISTREGRVLFLEDLVKKSIELAEKIIEDKNPKLKHKNRVAKQVGIGAIIFNDLKQDRIKDIKFDWNKALSFDGDSCPYVQYAYVRANSILRKTKFNQAGYFNKIKYENKQERILIKKLSEFPDVVKTSAEQYKPHFIAQYLLDMATKFNDFYNTIRVVGTENEKQRILLVKAVSTVLRNGLYLLNIETPNEM